jgi:hypothetical protein
MMTQRKCVWELGGSLDEGFGLKEVMVGLEKVFDAPLELSSLPRCEQLEETGVVDQRVHLLAKQECSTQ